MKRCAVLAVVVIVLARQSVADIIRVPDDFPTIQIAIQEAQQDDIIILAQRTYFEAINFNGKRITIQSEDPLDPRVVNATVIDALDLGSVVTFLGSEGDLTKLRGVTVQGGQIGIDAHGALATVEHCVITDNGTGIRSFNGRLDHCTISDNGTGIENTSSAESFVLENSSVSNNSGQGVRIASGEILNSSIVGNGSTGVHVASSRVTILDSLISSNGIGVNADSPYGATIGRCIVSGNRGDGIRRISGFINNTIVAGNRGEGFDNCDGDIVNCTVVQNNSWAFTACNGTIRHCIIWANVNTLQGSSTPILSGTIEPFFFGAGGWDQTNDRWIRGDYHLLPDSPYIDAGDPFYGAPGDPAVDADGNPRVFGERIDIGAYEFQGDCEGADFDDDGIPDLCDKDTDDDGITNSFDDCDYTPTGTIINSDGRPRADLNLDCVVNLADFRIFQNDIR